MAAPVAMFRHVPAKLLALAAAVAEGGEAVRRTLVGIVAEAAPFDAGEIVFGSGEQRERFGLGALAEGEALAADDLLTVLGPLGSPLRFDGWEDMDGFPRTRERLQARGLRSLLAFPLGEGEGALVVARRQGWGFAAAPVPELEPVARMAGIALARARDLLVLGRQVEALEVGLPAGGSDMEALRRELISCRRARDASGREVEQLRRRLEAGEAGWREREAELRAEVTRLAAEVEQTQRELGRRWAEVAALASRLREREAELGGRPAREHEDADREASRGPKR